MFLRIDRYIGTMFLGYLVGAILLFVTIFLAIDVMSTLVEFKDVSLLSLAKYYAYYTPEIVFKMLPVSGLAATLFTISNLNKSNELVALMSSGMSLLRISLSIGIGVAALCVVSFVLSDQVLPNFAKQKNYTYYHDLKKNPSLYSVVRNERIWYRSHDMIFNIKTLNPKTQIAEGLTLYYFNQAWDLKQMVTASSVELSGEKWKLKKGSVTLFTEQSSFPLTQDFAEKVISMGEDSKDLSSTAHTSDVLSLSELKSYIKKNKEAGLDTVRYEVDYHSKYGLSFAALIMSMLGLPFGLSRARSGGAMMNIGICLGLVFAYWILLSSCLTLGNYGYLPPILAAWFPNVLMGSFGGILIWKKRF